MSSAQAQGNIPASRNKVWTVVQRRSRSIARSAHNEVGMNLGGQCCSNAINAMHLVSAWRVMMALAP